MIQSAKTGNKIKTRCLPGSLFSHFCCPLVDRLEGALAGGDAFDDSRRISALAAAIKVKLNAAKVFAPRHVAREPLDRKIGHHFRVAVVSDERVDTDQSLQVDEKRAVGGEFKVVLERLNQGSKLWLA